jgi:DNA-binding LacI/PurR family transcriptional regulator
MKGSTRRSAPPAQSVRGKRTSLKDLAAYLKVDPSTVSVVLNEVPGRSISHDTRERIKAAAKLLNYRPSLLARSLRQRDTRTVGILLPVVGEEYHAQVLGGVASELERNQYSYLIAQHRHSQDKLRDYIEMLISRGVQGFIAIDTHLTSVMHVPTVAVAGHQRLKDVTNVMLNHERAAILTMQHLNELGHRRIAVIRGQPASSDSETRWAATSAAAKKFNLQIPRKLVMQLDRDITSPELGYTIVQKLMKNSHDFTAIVCFNDIAALGAIRAVGDARLRMPEDISVIGFDDIRMSVFSRPSLTTIRQPLHEMGQTAAKILLNRLKGEQRGHDVAVEPELIIRESSGKAPQRIPERRVVNDIQPRDK